MTDYSLLLKQTESLAKDSPELISLLANASALLFQELEDINWAGFYLVRDHELILGPFQGKVACTRIDKGKGVCGTAWETDRIQCVADVHLFPGHIACDSTSNSEVVIPIHFKNEVVAVMDIDSTIKNRFDEADCKGLTDIVKIIEGNWTSYRVSADTL